MPAKILMVVEKFEDRGDGTTNDPERQVRQFWDTDGQLLAERDLWRERYDAARVLRCYVVLKALQRTADEPITVYLERLHAGIAVAVDSLEGHERAPERARELVGNMPEVVGA